MKGPQKETVKLSEQGVVTEEALIAYLHNKLSPEEKQELEKLLLQDPFAQDALEGLQTSANQAAVTTSISSLNKKVRERSGLKERKKLNIHWANYAWAAVLIGLLIGIGFVMVNFLNKGTDHNLALNEKKDNPATPVFQQKDTAVNTEKSPVTISDSVSTGKDVVQPDTASARVVTTAGTTAGTGGVNSQNKPAPVPVQNSATSNQVASYTTTAPTNTFDKSVAAVSPKANDNAKLKDAAAGLNTRADTTSSYGYYAAKNNGVTVAELSKKELKPDGKDLGGLQDEAMKSFNLGDYNTAADDFDRILKQDPNNADALYFGGISDYINGKTAKSEENFDKLLKKGNNYLDGSKWYKANILLKKGKTDAAKTLLQDLTNSNGSYKERAIKKLAELGF